MKKLAIAALIISINLPSFATVWVVNKTGNEIYWEMIDSTYAKSVKGRIFPFAFSSDIAYGFNAGSATTPNGCAKFKFSSTENNADSIAYLVSNREDCEIILHSLSNIAFSEQCYLDGCSADK